MPNCVFLLSNWVVLTNLCLLFATPEVYTWPCSVLRPNDIQNPKHELAKSASFKMLSTGACPFYVQVQTASLDADVLRALSNVIDPDFGEDIVKCGFVKNLEIDAAAGHVAFTLELTTPACPVKEMFQRQATEFVKVSHHMMSQHMLSQHMLDGTRVYFGR